MSKQKLLYQYLSTTVIVCNDAKNNPIDSYDTVKLFNYSLVSLEFAARFWKKLQPSFADGHAWDCVEYVVLLWDFVVSFTVLQILFVTMQKK